ncbi:MAG: FAD-dependent oxidoreductase, partial [Gammaproteobacteria bacterium]|nr:FAD-dependent oxidoreductase [Gammaproteobacteria bacterium]
IYIRPIKFYKDRNIDLQCGVRVVAIDRDTKTISTDNDQTLAYDKLLICTGSRPRLLDIPGSDLPGIHYLRRLDDVDRIREDMKEAQSICIIGGGYIGLEVAAVAVSAGLTVNILEMESRILQRVTNAEMSAFYHRLHTSRGVNIHTSTACTGFSGDARIQSVLCRDHTIAADMVVVGIGILPNTELAEQAGLQCDNGILVDDHCRTSDPDIFSAGDCTNHPNPLLARRLRLESVPNAMEQARTAATNMLGGDKTYAAIPWFWSDQYELKLQMVGFSADGETAVVRGNPEELHFATFYLNQGKVVAVDAVNSPKEFMVAKRLYGLEVNAETLTDTSIDLKSLIS